MKKGVLKPEDFIKIEDIKKPKKYWFIDKGKNHSWAILKYKNG